MTQLQDEARHENYALFQLRAMKGNLVLVKKSGIAQATIDQLARWIDICENEVQGKRINRMNKQSRAKTKLENDPI